MNLTTFKQHLRPDSMVGRNLICLAIAVVANLAAVLALHQFQFPLYWLPLVGVALGIPVLGVCRR